MIILIYFTDISTIAFTPTNGSETIGLPTKKDLFEELKQIEVIEL